MGKQTGKSSETHGFEKLGHINAKETADTKGMGSPAL